MPRTDGRTHGRILPHQRETNDTAETLGADLEIENYEADLHQTKDLQISTGTRRDYRNRLRRIIKYWEKEYPEYAAVGVRTVSEEDQKNASLYYFDGWYKQDIVYSGMNVKMFLKFLIEKEDLGDDKILSFNNIQKYKDAVIWGSKTAGTPLSITFY